MCKLDFQHNRGDSYVDGVPGFSGAEIGRDPPSRSPAPQSNQGMAPGTASKTKI